MTLLDIPTVPDPGELAPFQTTWLASAEDTTELVASIFRPSDCAQEPWGEEGTGEALLSDRDMLGGLGLAEGLCDDVESARAVLFVTAMTWVRLRVVEADVYETGPEVRASEMLESLGDYGTEGRDGSASVAVRAQVVFDMLCQIPTDVPEAQQVASGITWLADMVTETECGARGGRRASAAVCDLLPAASGPGLAPRVAQGRVRRDPRVVPRGVVTRQSPDRARLNSLGAATPTLLARRPVLIKTPRTFRWAIPPVQR